MGTLSDNHVLDLLAAGADSMPNMFDVVITLPQNLNDTNTAAATGVEQSQLTLRAKGFTVPVASNATYKVAYKTIEIARPMTKITFDRTFDITFRLDSGWLVYKQLNKWSNYFSNPITGFATSQLDDVAMGTVQVSVLYSSIVADSDTGFNMFDGIDSNTLAAGNSMSWTFDKAWCTKVTQPAFTAGEASAPQEITATFQFGTMTSSGGELYFGST
jgi:hypothetical protein